MGLRGLRLSTGGARRRGARLPRLLGALAVTTSAAAGVMVPGQAAADAVSPVGHAVVESLPPARAPAPAPPHSHDGETARTGTAAERLWLLGGVALSLTAAGVVAVAATRVRRSQ
jgi:hypothetical protein